MALTIPDSLWKELHDQSTWDESGTKRWHVAKLVDAAKSLPVMNVPLEHLHTGKTIEGIPIMLFVEHMKKILGADLSYPVILQDDGRIMDGAHRAAKAIFLEEDTIKAVRFVKNPEPDYIEED